MFTRKMIVAMFISVLVSMSTTVRGIHYYVDKNGDDSDGLSWATAFHTIQQGIDASNPTIVEVKEDTYSETIDFDGVACTVTSTDPDDLEVVANTIIDSSGETQGVYFHNSEGADSVLTGFTVINGTYGVKCDSAGPTISKCIIENHTYYGAFFDSSSAKIENCIIKDNTYDGIYLTSSSSSVKSNWIYDNGRYGVIIFSSSSAVLRNNTIVANTTAGIYKDTGTQPTISNCILWGNDDDLYNCTATYSCIQNGDSGNGNISSNPDFADYDGRDFHLLWDSPCINSGDESGNYNGETDIDGEDRVIDDRVDMGADEAVSYISIDPESFNVNIYEGETGIETLTIGNSGQGDLHFNIWPSNKEALEMSGAEMEEGYSSGYEVDSSENEIVLEYDFSEPVITNDGTYDHLTIEGLDNFEQVGAPIIPMRSVKALVPYGKKVIDIKLHILNKDKLHDTYFLPPAQEPIPISSNNVIKQTKPDPEIYGSNKPWPGPFYRDPITQSKRGYQLYFVKLFPVQYQPKSGKVSYVSKLRLTIKLADKTTETILRPTRELKSYLTKTVDNPKALSTYPSTPVGGKGGTIIMSEEGAGSDFVPGQSYDYIIITSKYLLEATPGPWNFQRLRDSKIARGLSAAIVTTEWIYDEYAGTGEDNQALIRNFLIDAYYWHDHENSQYALLGGSDEIIPVREFYGYFEVYSIEDGLPCDMYYGCLDANCNFNYDGDEWYGESNDGVDGNEIDLEAEIYIGRAGVKTVEDVSNFVQKTLIYNATISDYLTRVSMVGQVVDWVYAKDTLEPIRDIFNKHNSPDFFDFDTSKNLYEKDYIWEVGELIDIMNNGVHVLDHLAHSSSTGIGKFSTTHLSQLANEDYYFVYSKGCHPGAFDLGLEQCFAEQVTVKPHGAFAAIMNSRYGLIGKSEDFNEKFWYAVFNGDPEDRILEIGRANQVSKEEYFSVHYETIGYNRWIYFVLNVFGDPEQQFLFGQARDSAWLDAEPESGIVEGEDSRDIDINFNAESLAAGTYEGEIIITSSDHPKPTITVPATMTVLQQPPAVTPYDIFETTRQRENALFVPESMTYTLTNNGTTSLNWTASSTENWTDINPDTGNLEPSEAIDVVISLNQNAYDLPKGYYYCNINFTNTSTGNTHERGVFLQYVDYFTEVFEYDALDIEYQTLTFYPDGSNDFYTVCRQSASEFPTDTSDGDTFTPHEGGTYGEEEIVLSDQKQVSLYGVSYQSFYVLGSGIITFESDENKRVKLKNANVSLDNYFGSPIISGLFSWLAPWAEGADFRYKQLEDRIAVTFKNVREYTVPLPPLGEDNSFQMELFFDGRIRITHLKLALDYPSQGFPTIVGLSEGSGIPEDFIESDLSEYSSSCPGVHNIDKNAWYRTIQDAIDNADSGDLIKALPGTYQESVDFKGKDITISSSDPSHWDTVAATIIDADGAYGVVEFNSGEDTGSVLQGFTLKNGVGFGVHCSSSSPIISNCIIEYTGFRGVACNYSASPTVINNIIRENTMYGIYYDISSPIIKNNIIYNNGDYGIFAEGTSSSAVVCNNTIVGHDYGIFVNGTSPTISNCIIWDNVDDLYGCNATYSCIEDCGDASGVGNICGAINDPMFVDANNDDYHLDTSSSPCFDTGDPNYEPEDGEKDIDGDDRVMNGRVDMGADELTCLSRYDTYYDNWIYWGKPECWCYQRQCRGDTDGEKEGSYWVSNDDNDKFLECFNKFEYELPVGCECADFDHQKTGPFWVGMLDLNILVTYLDESEPNVPTCEDCVEVNFWTN
jgi:parallel beta-helix repeat protein